MVAVIATYNGTLTEPDRFRPRQFRIAHNPSTWHVNTSNLTFVVYQRTNRLAPNFSPNYGFEAGVFVQFVMDHFDALPEMTLFLQDRPWQHNPHWLSWASCLRPNVSYAPMTHVRLARLYKANAQTDEGTDRDDAVVEQCWRDLLDAFRTTVLLPRETPHVAYFQGATFAASRRRLRNTPLATWQRVHRMMAGGDGRCHHGPLQWERLAAVRKKRTRVLDSSEGLGKHTSANAFEALNHLVIGGMNRESVLLYDYCDAFLPDCPRTPCGRLKAQPKYATSLSGRIEHERRRLAHEYTHLLKGVRTFAEASAAGAGSQRLNEKIAKEFGYLLGPAAGAEGGPPRLTAAESWRVLDLKVPV